MAAMSFSPADVGKVARLARLALSAAEVRAYAGDLSRILAMLDRVDAVDTAHITPLWHPGRQSLRMRADKVSEENRRDEFQQAAPAVEGGLYLVPRVLG